MKSKIKQLVKEAVGSETEFTFEERLVSSYILFGGIICLVSSFFNFWLHLGVGTVLLMIFSAIFLSCLFVLGRFYRKTFLSKLLLTTYTLIFCNIYWFTNYGSQGSATYCFLVFFFIMIFAWETFQIKIIGLIVLANIVGLFFAEMFIPGIIPPYPSRFARISDSYATLAVVLCFFAIIIINVKNNYVKQYQRAQQSDRLKTAFLANMSHEIRTPLHAIIGFSKLLIDRDLDKEKKSRYSNLITENGDYLMKLITDILDISMIESGHFNIEKSKVLVNSLLKQIFDFEQEIVSYKLKKDIRFILDIPEANTIIETDEIRLKQIVLNLVSNAIKYTAKGYIKLGYTLQPDKIVFFVEDTGLGIKKEFQQEVFNRFMRNEDSLEVRSTRGTGIGLSLSKELVQLLGGKIWFKSDQGTGTTFYFSLPITEIKDSCIKPT